MAISRSVTSTSVLRDPGIMMVVSFMIVAIINVIVIYLANMVAPQQVVLGTLHIPYWWALVLSSGLVSLATIGALAFINFWESRRTRVWSPPELMAMYLVVNFAALWLIARGAEFIGLGLGSWLVVLILAAVLDFLQGMVMMAVEKMR